MFGFLKKKKAKSESEEEYAGWPRLSDLKGYEEEISRLKSVATAIQSLAKGEKTYGYFPKGILLSGDPGTGKTTAAKGLIHDVGGLPTIVLSTDPSQEEVENAFAQAAELAPCFILIDDVDRLVPNEDPFSGFTSDQTQNMLKTLISCLDGVAQLSGVIPVMTANTYYGLNEALRRPGRIDLHIPFGIPDDASREEIVSYYLGQYGDVFDKSMSTVLANKMGGLSGAQIKTIINDVWLYSGASSDSKNLRPLEIFQKRIMEANTDGILKKAPMKPEDFTRVCYHEAGHAIAYYALKNEYTDICVLQQEGADFGGWTASRYDDDNPIFLSAEDCVKEVACCLAGLAAEKIKFGHWTTGVLSDMESANKVLSAFMLCCLVEDKDEPNFSFVPTPIPSDTGKVPSDIQSREKKKLWRESQEEILQKGYEMAKKAIEDNMELLEKTEDLLHSKYIVSAEMLECLATETKVGTSLTSDASKAIMETQNKPKGE